MKKIATIAALLLFACTACRKGSSTPDYLAKLTRLRNWHGTNNYNDYCSACAPTYTKAGIDTITKPFVLKVVGFYKLTVEGHLLFCEGFDDVGKTVVYGANLDLTRIELIYYYELDSAVYSYESRFHDQYTIVHMHTE